MLDEYLSEIISALFIGILLFLVARWWFRCNPHEKMPCTYGYSDTDGPHTWKYKFKIKGESQSPINIISVCSVVVPAHTCQPLDFTSEYHTSPLEMKLVNDGYTLAIYCNYEHNRKPVLCGGPLCDEYKLFCLRFRWGPNDEEGSEHMIDMRRYAMELQVTFNKCSCKCIDMSKSVRTCAVCIISYIFEATSIDNPHFETMLYGIRYVQRPCRSCQIRPFPISLIGPTFKHNYFTYIGSLTYPPCTEGVRWIVQPEPQNISRRQVSELRKLMGYDGPILTNVRPVQNTNNRDILFYE